MQPNAASAVEELGEGHPLAPQPPAARLALRPHQLTLLHRCILYERGPLNTREQFPLLSARAGTCDGHSLHTRIGIIGDRASSGKSFVVLALASMGFHGATMPVIETYGLNAVHVHAAQPGVRRAVRANLIVVPHSLAAQWETYAQRFVPHLAIHVVKSARDVPLATPAAAADADILLVTSTFYNRVIDSLNAAGVRFQRAFFDEVDNMNIPGCAAPDAEFVWFVTASYPNLINPRGWGRWSAQLNRKIWTSTGIRSMGYVKALFQDLAATMPPHFLHMLVVKNADEYVVRSMALSAVARTIVRCRTPKTINILNGLVDRMIIDHLNAGDVPAALQCIDPANKDTEENIVIALVDKYTRKLRVLDAKHAHALRAFEDGAIQDARAECNRLTHMRDDLSARIASIRERIGATNTCCICYEGIENKSVAPCCSNSYCLRCVSRWLVHKSDCPMCKSALRISDLLVVSSGVLPGSGPGGWDPAAEVHKSPENAQCPPCTSCANSKAKNLEILLRRRRPGDKFMIFSSYDRALANVGNVLAANRVRFSYLKGNQGQVASILRAYNGSDSGGNGNALDVLLVNPDNYGCGINMERTTDIVMLHKFDSEIERQVIGRAHRVGRMSELRVWYLLYDDESPEAPEAPEAHPEIHRNA